MSHGKGKTERLKVGEQMSWFYHGGDPPKGWAGEPRPGSERTLKAVRELSAQLAFGCCSV